MDTVACPEPGCGERAELVDVYVLDAAGSPPVLMAATSCPNRHNVVDAKN